jgi:hypothetical protein
MACNMLAECLLEIEGLRMLTLFLTSMADISRRQRFIGVDVSSVCVVLVVDGLCTVDVLVLVVREGGATTVVLT